MPGPSCFSLSPPPSLLPPLPVDKDVSSRLFLQHRVFQPVCCHAPAMITTNPLNLSQPNEMISFIASIMMSLHSNKTEALTVVAERANTMQL